MELQINQWKAEISSGNRCFNQQRISDAIRHYENAKTVACALFPYWQDTQAAAAAVVVSYHNLADVYLREKLPEHAEIELRKSHNFILNALRDDERQQSCACSRCYDEARTDILLKTASRTYLALIQHQGKYQSKSCQSAPIKPPVLTH